VSGPSIAIEAGPEIPTAVKDLSSEPGSPASKHTIISEATETYDPDTLAVLALLDSGSTASRCPGMTALHYFF